MPLLQNIDFALTKYLNEGFAIKGIEHTYKDNVAVCKNVSESMLTLKRTMPRLPKLPHDYAL